MPAGRIPISSMQCFVTPPRSAASCPQQVLRHILTQCFVAPSYCTSSFFYPVLRCIPSFCFLPFCIKSIFLAKFFPFSLCMYILLLHLQCTINLIHYCSLNDTDDRPLIRYFRRMLVMEHQILICYATSREYFVQLWTQEARGVVGLLWRKAGCMGCWGKMEWASPLCCI